LETSEELAAFIDEVAADGARGQLMERGVAWSLFRQNGVLPVDAPPLGEDIETDLAEYGFSLLRAALSLQERSGSSDTTRRGFERAGRVFEALTTNNDPESPETGYFRVLGAAAYHLGSYSAIAYSLLRPLENPNVNAAERALSLLILRDLSGLRTMTKDYLRSEEHSDRAVAQMLDDEGPGAEEALSVILNVTVCRALAYFDFALQTGEAGLVESVAFLLTTGRRLAAEAGAVSLWWIVRLCRGFIDDLWQYSLHQRLPLEPPQGADHRLYAVRLQFEREMAGATQRDRADRDAGGGPA
jgi:hypothetical protein